MVTLKPKTCPFCGMIADDSDLTRHYFSDNALIQFIKERKPKWSEQVGACSKCLEEFKRVSDSEVSQAQLLQSSGGEEQTVITYQKDVIPEATAEENACLITIHGENLGKKYDMDLHEMVLGRSETANIRIDEENVSRHHAKITRVGAEYVLEDLSSTNGTFVNTKKITKASLKEGDLVLIGNSILKFISGSNIENLYHDEIYKLATLDGLTQIYNKKFLLEKIQTEFSRSKRYTRDMSFVMYDFDHFKKLNDQYGHQGGDFILKKTASLILKNLRKEDIFGRYGGEEFAIILPETHLQSTVRLCEKLRLLVAGANYEFNNLVIKVTISIGAAALTPNVLTFQDLVEKADRALYRAKREGRNKVIAHTE